MVQWIYNAAYKRFLVQHEYCSYTLSTCKQRKSLIMFHVAYVPFDCYFFVDMHLAMCVDF